MDIVEEHGEIRGHGDIGKAWGYRGGALEYREGIGTYGGAWEHRGHGDIGT